MRLKGDVKFYQRAGPDVEWGAVGDESQRRDKKWRKRWTASAKESQEQEGRFGRPSWSATINCRPEGKPERHQHREGSG